jgi:hypothetical protein
MATQLPPLPNNPITDTFVWRDWFFKVSQILVQSAQIAWSSLDFTNSNIRNIAIRQHNALQDLQGGLGVSEMYHLSSTQYNSIATLPTFGTMAIQNANAVAITGGSIAGTIVPTGGISATITTAALTGGGTQGSMTFVNGILTAQTQAT